MKDLIHESQVIWEAGGPLMIPLAILAFGLFYSECRLLLQLNRYRRTSLEAIPLESHRSIPLAFESAREEILQPVDRRIRHYAILVGVCPLVGLLGTVAGMTTTFTAMGQPGISNLSFEVAGGISEALVTTQAGLLVAIPGMIFLTFLRRARDRIALQYFSLEAKALEKRPLPESVLASPTQSLS